MGFKLNVDLETSDGPSHEVYVRIESLVFNKVTSNVMFQLTYWIDQEHAKSFNREYLDEDIKNAVGLIQERVLYFPDQTSDGEEILLSHHYEIPVVREDEVEIPEFEIKTIHKEVPYTSFDEEGEEITLYRTVSREEKVQIGTRKEIKKVIDTKLIENIFDFCYQVTKTKLMEFFPEDKIETIN